MALYGRLKHLLFGQPIATKHAHHERLPKRIGLAVFASDALSSVAYATEEVLIILVLGGLAAYYDLLWISAILCILLFIVVFSYYQTIHAYPEGGGSYIVSKSNIGAFWGKVAGAALLMDYVLTVAVSISSGVSFLVSAFPHLQPYMVPLACGAIAIIAYANLRGMKESGIVFALPTYSFISLILLLIICGLINGVGKPPIEPQILPPPEGFHALGGVAGFIFLSRAFAASCTAMTGIEAIADGVAAFKAPEPVNASKTLVIMASLLACMFLGVSWCAQHYGITPMATTEPGYQTVVAQLASAMYGEKNILFFATSICTTAILFVAANTAFADFPRLASFLARDGYLPRQMLSVGDRLVFQNGIILLAIVSMILVVAFDGDTHSLIPLYAVGVFTAFTLSQSGMVARWRKMGKRGFAFYLNLFGAIATGIVTIVLSLTKFWEGAWITIFAIGGIMLIFNGIRRHYDYLARELTVGESEKLPDTKTTVLLLVPRVHRGVLHAIAYAKSMARDVRALHVTLDPKNVASVKNDWMSVAPDIPLVILESPYRSLVGPVLEYVDQAIAEDPHTMVTVIVPQAVPKYWWHGLLHNNAAVLLKLALGGRKNVVITNVRYFLN
jgi:amino acid transporter